MRALLVGVGRIEFPEISPLEGPANDVAILRDLLVEQLTVDPANVISYVDQSGTRQNIMEGLRGLAAESRDEDAVFFYFGGHAQLDDDESAPYLVTHDSTSKQVAGISPIELHRLLAEIPAASKVAVIDSGCSPSFVRLLQQTPVATVVFATAPGNWSFETKVAGIAHGAFTTHLVKAWGEEIQAGVEQTWGSLFQGIRKDLQQAVPGANPAPFMVGDEAEPLPKGRFPAPDLWRLDRLRRASAPPSSVVAMCARKKWPNGRRVIARSDQAAGRFQSGSACPEVGRPGDRRSMDVAGPRAQVAARRFGDALLSLEAFNALTPTISWPARDCARDRSCALACRSPAPGTTRRDRPVLRPGNPRGRRRERGFGLDAPATARQGFRRA